MPLNRQPVIQNNPNIPVNPNFIPNQFSAPQQNNGGYYNDLEFNKKRELDAIKQKLMNIKHKEVLGSAIFLPRQFRFATQNPTEEILMLTRSHWIVNLGWILRSIFMSILPVLIISIYYGLGSPIEFINAKTISLFLLAYYSLMLTTVIKEFTDWYFDPFIVTNERIVSYNFKPFASYHISETMLQSLDIVREESLGIIGNIFNYGDIRMVTEAQHLEFRFRKIPNPTEVRNLITDLTLIAKKYDK